MEQTRPRAASKWNLFAVLAVCAAPAIFSYLTYYVIKPQARNNYGDLIDPRHYPLPALGTTSMDGKPVSLADFKGKWVMLQVNSGECNEACRTKLYEMRQLRLTQGKEMQRIERVWLITDNKPLETTLMREYEGMHMLRANPVATNAWLPTVAGTAPSDHLYMLDPLGNLMMRFPKNADPNRIKKDISKLLRASSIG